MLFTQVRFQNFLVPRSTGTNEVKIFRENSDVFGATRIYGRAIGSREIVSKWQAGIIFVEIQNGARQRVSVKDVRRDANRHPRHAKQDELHESANWLQSDSHPKSRTPHAPPELLFLIEAH